MNSYTVLLTGDDYDEVTVLHITTEYFVGVEDVPYDCKILIGDTTIESDCASIELIRNY
jgi:hypothetical protein